MKNRSRLILVLIVILVPAVPGLAGSTAMMTLTAEILDPLAVSTLNRFTLTDAAEGGLDNWQMTGIDYEIRLDWNQALENRFSVELPSELALSLNGRDVSAQVSFSTAASDALSITTSDVMAYRLVLTPDLHPLLAEEGESVSGSALITVYANY